MLKSLLSTPPKRPAAPEDLRLAAHAFETKARFVSYSGTVALQLHTTDSVLVDRLVSAFGGGSYLVPGSNTWRWRVSREGMQRFLEQIGPWLSDAGRARIVAAQKVLEAEASAKQARRLNKDIRFLDQQMLKTQFEEHGAEIAQALKEDEP